MAAFNLSSKRKAFKDFDEDPPAKRMKLSFTTSDLSLNPRTASVTASSVENSGLKPHKVNVGGRSRMEWFNKLVRETSLQAGLRNLCDKIRLTETSPTTGCIHVVGFTEHTRPTMDAKYHKIFKVLCVDGPERFSPYVIALAQAGITIPEQDPPAYPQELRKVTNKRHAVSATSNEKAATWVASHLCHNKRCINVEHLRWEPSWMNRLRDNCLGGHACLHGPDKCKAAHRDQKHVIDWTDYLETPD